MNQTPLDGSPDGVVERALSSVIDMYGSSLLREPDRLKVYLDRNCAGATREIALVMAAVTEGVPQAMLAAHSDDDLKVLLPQLVKRLIERAAIGRSPATWAVRAWAHTLAVSSSVLDDGRIAEAPATSPNATQRSSAAEVLRIASPAVLDVAPPPMRPEASAPPAVTRLIATTEVAADEHREGVAAAHPAVANEVMSYAVPDARGEDHVEAGSHANDEVRADVQTEIPNATAARSRAGSSGADALTSAYSQPPSPGRHGRPLGSALKVAAAVAAVVVVVLAIRWDRPGSAPIDAAPKSVSVSPQNARSTPPAPQPESAPANEVASRTEPVPPLANSAVSAPPITPPASRPIAAPSASAAKAAKSSSAHPAGAGARNEPRRAASPLATAPTIVPASAECTRSTCGSVVAVHAIDDDSTSVSAKSTGQMARAYEITIRMDDRSIHTIAQSIRWQPGARVQMRGSRFVQIDKPPSAR